MQPKGTDGEWLPDFDPLELTEKGGFVKAIRLYILIMFPTICKV